MKKLVLLAVVLCSLSICGCNPTVPVGPRANPLGNRSEGHWKLTSLYKNKDKVDVAQADTLTFLKMSEYTKYDSAYQTQNPHYVFTFLSKDYRETKVLDAIPWGYESSQGSKTETQWYAISKEVGFRIIFHFVEGSNQSYQMDISNVMRSPEYRAEMDTMSYVYTPTEKF